MPHPCTVVRAAAAESQAQERVGTALAKLLHDLLQQRPSPRRTPHDHLPAALYDQACIEQQLGVAFNTTISHRHTFSLRPGGHDHKGATEGSQGSVRHAPAGPWRSSSSDYSVGGSRCGGPCELVDSPSTRAGVERAGVDRVVARAVGMDDLEPVRLAAI